MTNAVTAGFLSGAILARKSGLKAMTGGALAFAGFSAAIDLFIRRETSELVCSHLHFSSTCLKLTRIIAFSSDD